MIIDVLGHKIKVKDINNFEDFKYALIGFLKGSDAYYDIVEHIDVEDFANYFFRILVANPRLVNYLLGGTPHVPKIIFLPDTGQPLRVELTKLDFYGEVNWSKKLLKLNTSLPNSFRRRVLVHELIETYVFQRKINPPHIAVVFLEYIVYYFFTTVSERLREAGEKFFTIEM